MVQSLPADAPANFCFSVWRTRIVTASGDEARHRLPAVEIPPSKRTVRRAESRDICKFIGRVVDGLATGARRLTCSNAPDLWRDIARCQCLSLTLHVGARKDWHPGPKGQVNTCSFV